MSNESDVIRHAFRGKCVTGFILIKRPRCPRRDEIPLRSYQRSPAHACAGCILADACFETPRYACLLSKRSLSLLLRRPSLSRFSMAMNVWLPTKTKKQVDLLRDGRRDFGGVDHMLVTEEGRPFGGGCRRRVVAEYLEHGAQGPDTRAAHQVSRAPAIPVERDPEQTPQGCACEAERTANGSSIAASCDLCAAQRLSTS